MPSSILGLKGSGTFAPAAPAARLHRWHCAIWATYLIAVAATVGVALTTALEGRSAQLASAHASSLILARVLEKPMARLFGTAEEYLVATRAKVEESHGVDRVSTLDLDRTAPKLAVPGDAIRRAVMLDDEGGRGGDGETSMDLEASRSGWLRGARENPDRGVQLQLPVRSAVDGRWIIPLTARVDKADGSFAGLIYGAIEMEFLAGFFRGLGVDSQGSIALVRGDGSLLIRYPDTEGLAGRRLPQDEYAGLQGSEGTFDVAGSRGAGGRLVAFRKATQHPFYVVLERSEDQVLARWKGKNITRSLTGGGVILLFSVLTALLSRRLEREVVTTTSLAHFADAVDRSAEMVLWIRSDGQFVYANEAAMRRLGHEPAKISTLSVREVCPEYSSERWDAVWKTLREKGDLRITTEAATSQGARFPIGIVATHVVIEGQAYAFAMARDLTEEHRAHGAILALNRTLEQKVLTRTEELQRANEALASFSYSVSHDLRAPLRHLSGYARILGEQPGLAAAQEGRELLERIGERARHMDDLIAGLLRLSTVDHRALQPREIDLSAMAREVACDLANDNPDRHVALTVEEGMRTFGDPVLLRALLQNLLGNAWKYSAGQARAEVRVSCDRGTGMPIFQVRDNGVGFDPSQAERLFGAFQRLHSASEFPGTGIGLATARRIVERHGGRIWAWSAAGQGALFSFTIASPDATPIPQHEDETNA
jgi:PAS domain S-box-containing protein